VTRPTGRQQHSEATRRRLVEAARELFAEQGYAATSLDAIVAGAQVSKGALYHHFSGKQAVFEAVLESLETRAGQAIGRSGAGVEDPWARATAGLRALVEEVQRPDYRRVVVQEGPAVLGHERVREQERATDAAVVGLVRDVLTTRSQEPDEATVRTVSRTILGALSSAGEDADGRADVAVDLLLEGLRSLAAQRVTSPR